MNRKSNFEIMRIISMFMIIVWHIIIHGNLLPHTTGAINFCLNLILSICVIHVNSFILITGYFNHNKKFKINKITSLLNASWFYCTIIVIILSISKVITLNNVEILKKISYLPFNENWFIVPYIMLYCMSPFLNILIRNMNKKQYKTLLWTLLIMFSILPSLSGQQIFNVTSGYSLYHFVFLYLLGAYFSIYPIERSEIFSSFNKKKIQLTLIILFFSLLTLNISLFYLSKYLNTVDSNILKEISMYIDLSFRCYSNPLVIIQSLCYVLFFKTLTIQNNKINNISPYVFGVYLIHDNSMIRGVLYKWIKIDTGGMLKSNIIFLKILFWGIVIMVVCMLIEFIRKKIFKFISNLEVSKKILMKINNYIENFNEEEKEETKFSLESIIFKDKETHS